MADPVRLEPLEPEEAVRFFRSKGLAESFAWQDVWEEEHARAFTVAKAMERGVLEEIRAAVDTALSEGRTFEQFRGELQPTLEALGWWGRAPMTDPQTGETREVQLGSPRRLRTIFNMNLRSAYAAGRWERIEESKALLPILVYTTSGDARVRPEHRAWDGVALPVDDPWWDTHYPPCDWGCRCTVLQMSARFAAAQGHAVGAPPPKFQPRPYTNPRTGEVTTVESGIGPGFSYNVGKAYLRRDTPTLLQAGETDDALAAAIQDDLVEAFLAAFAATEDDRTWLDPEGYPQVIGPGLFRDAADAPIALSAEQLQLLTGAARALTDPVSIGWVWVRRGESAPLLLRRYRDDQVIVDMASGGGSPAWRMSAV